MLEFLQNIWGWVISNKDAIVTTVTSANFVSIIGAIIVCVRTSKQAKKNMTLSENLNGNLIANTALLNTVKNIEVNQEIILENLKKLNNDLELLDEKVVNFDEKITLKNNAIIEALQTAWSTIKDDNIRTTVAGILTNARYKETSKIEEMKTQIEELKKRLLEENERITQQVVDTVDEVKVVIDAKSNEMKTVSRA